MNIERHNRNVRESLWTAEEAIAWAVRHHADTGKWPTRRFRVATHLGNSRLLQLASAERTQRKYGGKLEELIPSRSAYLGRPEAKQRAADVSDPLQGAQ